MNHPRPRRARIGAALNSSTELKAPASAPTLLSDYVTPEQLAIELDKSLRTIHRWDRLRIGPPRTMLGRKAYYKRSSVAAWLERQERDPAAEALPRRRRA